jgi:hypothetical protein
LPNLSKNKKKKNKQTKTRRDFKTASFIKIWNIWPEKLFVIFWGGPKDGSYYINSISYFNVFKTTDLKIIHFKFHPRIFLWSLQCQKTTAARCVWISFVVLWPVIPVITNSANPVYEDWLRASVITPSVHCAGLL